MIAVAFVDETGFSVIAIDTLSSLGNYALKDKLHMKMNINAILLLV